MTKINKNWFKAKLKEKKLTQKQIASQMGKNPAMVNRLLTGERRMTIYDAENLAHLLGVHIFDVLKNMGVRVSQKGKNNTLMKSILKTGVSGLKKPRIADLFTAFEYRILLLNLVKIFKKFQMPVAANHLELAYKEIDRIWEENDFRQPVF